MTLKRLLIVEGFIYYVMNVEGEEKTLSRCKEIAKQGYENEDGVNILKNILEKEIHSKSLYVFMDIATEKSQKLIMETLKDRLSSI